MKSNKIARLILVLALVAGCGGGGSGGGGVIPPPAALAAIAVTPSNPSIPLGIAEQFTAMGTYSDGSKRNLTASVTWTSMVPGVATISNAAGLNGLAISKGLGSTAITAASGTITSL